MSVFVAGGGKVGGRCSDFGDVLCHGGSSSNFLRFGDVGYVPMHWEDARRLPPSGGLQTDGAAAKEEAVKDMGLTPTGGGNGGGVHTGGRHICHPPP